MSDLYLEYGCDARYNTIMHDDTITKLTVRGQTSVPSRFRRQAKMKAGQRLRWAQISETEFHVAVETREEAPGPLAVLGWARRFQRGAPARTDDVMKELRAGEHD